MLGVKLDLSTWGKAVEQECLRTGSWRKDKTGIWKETVQSNEESHIGTPHEIQDDQVKKNEMWACSMHRIEKNYTNVSRKTWDTTLEN